MGKAEIVSSHGRGVYTARLLYNEQRARDTIQQLRDQSARFDDRLSKLQEAKEEAREAVEDAKSDLDQAIRDYNAAIGTSEEPEKRQAMMEAQKAFINQRTSYSQAASEYEMWRLEQASVERRIDLIERHLPDDPELDVLCVDYSEDLSGTVGTIEPLGVADEVRIRPGYEDGAAYDPARDGQLVPVISQTAAQTLYNYMMLPGWQKWQPLYRVGTITSIDTANDTCNLDLAQAQSGITGLSVNDSESLSEVPVEYMYCNSLAFSEGDEVIVEFRDQDWGDPVVIGFYTYPQQCIFYLSITINSLTPRKSHTVALFDAETEEQITRTFSDRNGVASFFWPEGYKPGDIVPGIWHEEGRLFAHFVEDPDGAEVTAGIDKGTRDSTYEHQTDYYTFDMSSGTYTSDTKHLSQLEWLLSKYTLADLLKDEDEQYSGQATVEAYQVAFDGLKKMLYRSETRDADHSIVDRWIVQSEVGWVDPVGPGGDDRFFELLGSELSNKRLAIAFEQGTHIEWSSVSSEQGEFDSGFVRLGPCCIGDTYTITFQDSENFTIKGAYSKEINGETWQVQDEGNINEVSIAWQPAQFPSAREDVQPILSIPPAAWSGTWREGDQVQIEITLGTFSADVYYGPNDEGVWANEVGANSNPEHVATQTCEEDLLVWLQPMADPSCEIHRLFWRGVWSEGDTAVFDRGNYECRESANCDTLCPSCNGLVVQETHQLSLDDYQGCHMPISGFPPNGPCDSCPSLADSECQDVYGANVEHGTCSVEFDDQDKKGSLTLSKFPSSIGLSDFILIAADNKSSPDAAGMELVTKLDWAYYLLQFSCEGVGTYISTDWDKVEGVDYYETVEFIPELTTSEYI